MGEHLTLIIPLLVGSTVAVVWGAMLASTSFAFVSAWKLGRVCVLVGIAGFWSAALMPEWLHHGGAVSRHAGGEHHVYSLDGQYHSGQCERLIGRAVGPAITIREATAYGLVWCPDCTESGE